MAAFTTVPLSIDWFVENISEHTKREEIIQFQELLGFNYKDIVNDSKKEEIAKLISERSSIFFEIARNKGGAFFPEKVYREDVNFYNKAPYQIPEADELILNRPMCYSLNFRFKTLNRVIIPYIFDTRLKEREGIVVGNLGSGLGRDLEYASLRYRESIKRIINIDLEADVVKIGNENIPEQIKNKVQFYRTNFLKGNPENSLYDFALLVGIICPLSDESAEKVLRIVYGQMSSKGTIAVSSSSYKMAQDDPICSINIQLCAQWSLNCRTQDRLSKMLQNVGFKNIEILSEPSGYNLIGVGTKE